MALVPITLFQSIGEIPDPGLLVVILFSVKISLFFFFISFKATMLLRAIVIFSLSESVTFLYHHLMQLLYYELILP